MISFKTKELKNKNHGWMTETDLQKLKLRVTVVKH